MSAMRARPLTARNWIVCVVAVLVGAAVIYSIVGWNVLGYAKGRIDAGRAVAEGRAELRSIGLPSEPRGSFDPETGLFTVTLGCCPTGWDLGYRSGWNSAVRAAFARGECDAVSLRRKVRTLDDLKAAFAHDSGSPPDASGRCVDPSGRYEIECSDAGIVVHPGSATSGGWVGAETQNARVLFADDGTTLLVDASTESRRSFVSIDLPSARVLQRWSEWIGPPPQTPGCPGPRSERK